MRHPDPKCHQRNTSLRPLRLAGQVCRKRQHASLKNNALYEIASIPISKHQDSFREARAESHVPAAFLTTGLEGRVQPRRYKAFLIIPVSRAPRSPSADGQRGARDQQRAGAAIPAGLKPRPSGSH